MELIKFSFEDLKVWQKAVEFSILVLNVAQEITSHRKHYRLIEQLESASTSVALNIAEGKGRYSKKEFIQFLYVARGSLYETAALLIILNKINLLNEKELANIRYVSDEIGKMLSGLIKSLKYTQPKSCELRAVS